MELTTHLFLAPWVIMCAVIRLRPLYAVMTWTRTTIPCTHIPFKTGFAGLLNLNSSNVWFEQLHYVLCRVSKVHPRTGHEGLEGE